MTSQTATAKKLSRIVKQALTQSSGRLPDAAEKLIAIVVESQDPTLILEMVGRKNLQQIALQIVKEAAFATETGARAAVAGAGQKRVDNREHFARPGASNPAPPVGGGRMRVDAHNPNASPGSMIHAEVPVQSHIRRIKANPNKPAVSPQMKGKVALAGAQAMLAGVRCGNMMLVDLKPEEALTWAARQREVSMNVIKRSKLVIEQHEGILAYDVRVAEHFATNLPNDITIGQFYETHPEEYARRENLIIGAGENVDA